MGQPLDPITRVTREVGSLLAVYFEPRLWDAMQVISLPFGAAQFQKLGHVTPRLHLGWDGLKANGELARSFAGVLSFRLVIVVKSNDPRGRMLGDKFSPGIYPTTMTAVAALHGRTICDIGTILVTDASQATLDSWEPMGAAAGIVSFGVHANLGGLLGSDAPEFTRLVSTFELGDGDASPLTLSADIPIGGDSA